MQKCLYLLYMCCCIYEGLAQTKPLDSLNVCLPTRPFTSKKVDVDHLNLLARSLGQKNARHPQQQEKYAQQAFCLAKKLKYTSGQLDALYQIGLSYYHRKDWTRSLSYFCEALKMLPSDKRSAQKASFLNLIGDSYTYLNKPNVALTYINQALRIYRHLLHKSGIAQSLVCKARALTYQGQHQTGLAHLFQALKYYQDVQSRTDVVYVLIKIGKAYRDMLYTSNAIKYFLQALDLLKTMDSPRLTALVYRKLSTLYDLLDQDQASLEYLFKALKIYQTLKDDYFISSMLSQITHIYFKLQNYAMAIHYGQKAYKLGKQLGNRSKAFWALGNLGLAYGGMQKHRQGIALVNRAIQAMKDLQRKYYRAFLLIHLGKIYLRIQDDEVGKKYLKSGIAIAQKKKYTNYVMIGTKALYQVYKQQGNTLDALKYLEQYIRIRDDVLSRKKSQLVTSLHHHYQIGNKQLENISLKQALNLKKQQIRQERLILWLTLGGMLVFLGGMVILFWMVRKIRRSNLLLKAQKSHILRTNALLTQSEEEIRSKAETIAQQRDRLAEVNQALQANTYTMARQKAQLASSLQKVEELGIFKEKMISMVTHDLKNPLSAIIGLSASGISLTDQQMIHQAGKRMMHLIRNLLDTQKLNTPHFQVQVQPLDLPELSQQAIQQVQWLAQVKKLQVHQHICRGDRVVGDADLLLRVLINLLHNALTYTPEWGQVTLCCETVASDLVKIKVIDTGRGIAPNDLSHIFEPYHHDNNNQASTGLGLTFCKMAIEAQGGKIGVESELGQGTLFWVTLPCDDHHQKETLGAGTQVLQHSNEVYLPIDQKTRLQPYLKKLKQHSVHDLTGVQAIIDEIEIGECGYLKVWETELRLAVFSLNQSRYESLIYV
mgnify:CR=1 FL=1